MKKGKLIALALAAGITFMGAGYAAWTDNVTIQTTVATGTLDYTFSSENNVTLYSDRSMNNEDTEVANAQVTYGTDGESGEADNNDKATVTITNAYPDAAAKIELNLSNGSSIPTNLDELVENVDDGLTLQNLVVKYNDGSKYVTVTKDSTDIPAYADVKVSFEIIVNDVDENRTGDNAYKVILTPKFKQFNH